MSTGTAADVDAANCAVSGANDAVSECDPPPSLTLALAVPPETGDEPIAVVPSRNVTVPVAAEGATVALSVSSLPAVFGPLTASVVVVGVATGTVTSTSCTRETGSAFWCWNTSSWPSAAPVPLWTGMVLPSAPSEENEPLMSFSNQNGGSYGFTVNDGAVSSTPESAAA